MLNCTAVCSSGGVQFHLSFGLRHQSIHSEAVVTWNEIIKTKQCVHTFKISLKNKIINSRIPSKEESHQKLAVGQKDPLGTWIKAGLLSLRSCAARNSVVTSTTLNLLARVFNQLFEIFEEKHR